VDHQLTECELLRLAVQGNKPVVAFSITDQFGNGAVSTKKLKFILNECEVSIA
jgi:hypothetical protein